VWRSGAGRRWAVWAWYGRFTPLAPPGYAELAGALGLVITGAVSMALFAVSAWPGAVGGFAADGRWLAMLARKGPMAERDTALTMSVSASLSGVRAQEYPAQLVARVTVPGDDSGFGLMGKFLAHYYALDRGEPAQRGCGWAK